MRWGREEQRRSSDFYSGVFMSSSHWHWGKITSKYTAIWLGDLITCPFLDSTNIDCQFYTEHPAKCCTYNEKKKKQKKPVLVLIKVTD